MSNKIVSILGCGWVGKALFDFLEKKTVLVHCLSRDVKNNDKEKKYICDVLVIAIPPRDNYLEVIEKTLSRVGSSTQIILFSSISFYDGKSLVVEAEALLTQLHEERVILRLGGLMGYDRVAGKYTAGRVVDSDSGTNYVHRDDVVAIIGEIIRQKVVGEIFDIVAPIQSTKREIFAQNAKIFCFANTEFLKDNRGGKELSPEKVCKHLGYTFKKENVDSFWDDKLDCIQKEKGENSPHHR